MKNSLLIVVSGLILVATGWLRWSGETLRRPLELDEAISLKYYTWAGVSPAGEPHAIRKIADYYSLPRPRPSHALLGLYCSLGRWTEPNNHVVNSTLMNVSVALGPRDERSARLPALLGGLGFALMLAAVGVVYLGSLEVAPLLVAWALWCPYVLQYSQEARGFTWMLALQAALILAAHRLSRKPDSVGWGFACAAIAVLSFMNVISTALDWVFPFYVCALLFPPVPRDSAGRGPWRKNLAVQVLAIGAVGFVFLMDRLPYVYSSLRQYGAPAHGLSGRFAHLALVVDSLFPTLPWKLFAALGLAGLALPAPGEHRWFLARLAVATLLVGLLHWLASDRLPYERVCGYVLPLLLLGAANLAVRALGRGPPWPRLWAVWVTLGACSLLLAVTAAARALGPVGLVNLCRDAPAAVNFSDRPVQWVHCLVRPDADSDWVTMYVPAGWHGVDDPLPPSGPVGLLVFSSDSAADRWDPASWSGRKATLELERYRLTAVRGTTSSFDDLSATASGDGRALVFWYPDPEAVAVTAQPVFDFLDRSQVRFLAQNIRHQVKLDVFGRLGDVILISGTPAEYAAACKAVKGGMARFGGRAVVFRPDPPSRPVPPPNPGLPPG